MSCLENIGQFFGVKQPRSGNSHIATSFRDFGDNSLPTLLRNPMMHKTQQIRLFVRGQPIDCFHNLIKREFSDHKKNL